MFTISPVGQGFRRLFSLRFAAVSLEVGRFVGPGPAGSAEEPEPERAVQLPSSAPRALVGANRGAQQIQGVSHPVLRAPASPERVGLLLSPSVFCGAELQEFSRQCCFVNNMLTFFNWKLL